METLRIEDLMVNDIVLAEAIWYDDETGEERIEWHPFLITDISSKCCLFCGDIEEGGFIGEWLDDCDAEEIRELKGMLLTPEILEANKFENRYSAGYQRLRDNLSSKHLTFYKKGGTFGDGVPGVDKKINLIQGIKYVHELQDALRVCKLRKLANNFKIKSA